MEMLRFQLSHFQLKNGNAVLKGLHFSDKLFHSRIIENVQNLE